MASVARRIARDEAGFAITELIVVSGLLTIVLGALVLFLDTTVKLAPEQQERGHVVQEGRLGLERMTRELRQGSTAVLTSPQELTFIAYVRPNGGAAEEREVTYDCSEGGECWRYEEGGSSERLVAGVENTDVFTQTLSAGVPRYVDITLELASEGADAPIHLRDGVELRNAPGS
jgi:hypothetical protein